MKKLFYLSAIMLLTLASCSTDEIHPWQEKGYVWFADTLNNFSFKELTDVAEGQTTLVAIPLQAATTVEDHDRTVNVEVVRQPADSRTQYEIQQPVLFRAGHTVDTMYVKVTRSAHLDTVHDTIQFRINPSDDFNPGYKAQQTACLCLFNGFTQPSWWTGYYCLGVYFGNFSQLKMEVYYNVTGGTEDPTMGEPWPNNINCQYIKQMCIQYVEEHDLHYPADDPNKPGGVPTFNYYAY